MYHVKKKTNVLIYHKTWECTDDEGKFRIVEGISKPLSIKKVSTLQLKKYSRTRCQMYVVHVLENKKKCSIVKDYPILQEFKDVFLDETPRLPPKRDIDFSIVLMTRAMPVSKVPYRMSTPELVEMKLQLKKMLGK
jgi:hypothetical protein